MLHLRTCAVGLVAVLLVGAAGCSTPPQTETPAEVASTPTSLETGTFVINPQFDIVESFSEGLARVRIGDDTTGKHGFIDKTGTFVINPQFDDARPFSEGLARVRIGDDTTGKWGFIDKTGSFVINPQFDAAGSFSEGLAAVFIGDYLTGKWGFIAR